MTLANSTLLQYSAATLDQASKTNDNTGYIVAGVAIVLVLYILFKK